MPFPPAAEYFIGSVNGELVSHLAVCPFFQASAYRATRLVVMPEWQGAGVGTKFLELICELHKNGGGRLSRRLPTFFHTSHPQLISYLKRNKNWVLKSQNLYGAKNAPKKKKREKTKLPIGGTAGSYGGHFRAVQGFKYIGKK